jgi:hypothetical protein
LVGPESMIPGHVAGEGRLGTTYAEDVRPAMYMAPVVAGSRAAAVGGESRLLINATFVCEGADTTRHLRPIYGLQNR